MITSPHVVCVSIVLWYALTLRIVLGRRQMRKQLDERPKRTDVVREPHTFSVDVEQYLIIVGDWNAEEGRSIRDMWDLLRAVS
jgi:hypothetical protein